MEWNNTEEDGPFNPRIFPPKTRIFVSYEQGGYYHNSEMSKAAGRPEQQILKLHVFEYLIIK